MALSQTCGKVCAASEDVLLASLTSGKCEVCWNVTSMDPSTHLPTLYSFSLQDLLTRFWSPKVIETEDSKIIEAGNSAEANNLKKLRVDKPEAGSVDCKGSRH